MRKALTLALSLCLICPSAWPVTEMTDVDQFGLPSATRANIALYMPSSTSTWEKWEKPRGVTMIYAMACGGGAGGGGGFSGIATAARAGGGGGATGGCARMLLPSFMTPGVLYVQPGVGGTGGIAGGNGVAGGISYISMGPYPAGSVANMTAATNLFLMSNAAGAGGGGGGSGTTAGSAGVAATVPVITAQTRSPYAAMWSGNVGLVGFIGGAIGDAAGTASSNVLGAAVPFSGGAGGGGVTNTGSAGGAVTGVGYYNTIPGGAFASTVVGGGGYSWSPTSEQPLSSTGGSGGAGVNAGVGGSGGMGGFPSSGGGGGGGGTTGGVGGPGGNGFVMIISW